MTAGELFKWRGCQSDLFMIFLPSVDLRHRRRDVHGGGHHRLLHIHRFRGLEEDPDRKTVLRTAPLPSSHLIYKCNVASLFAKSNPRSNQLPFWRRHHQDQRSSFGSRSNYQATKPAARLLGVLSGSVCPGDAWALAVTCPPAPFPASAGREICQASTRLGIGRLFLVLIFLA